MRPIRINKEIKDAFEKIIKRELAIAESHLSKAKLKITDLKKVKLTKIQHLALDEITNSFDKFLLYTPTEHATLIAKWKNLDEHLFQKAEKVKDKKTEFCKNILTALDYDSFREEYALEIVETLKLKVCPYCNAMLTIVTKDKVGKKKARCQLDHFFPKTKHPLLSISFFNLIPSCGNCNLAKRSNDTELGKDFHLYADETPEDGFTFEIPKDSAINYFLSGNLDKIKIDFKQGKNSDKKYADNHNKSYDIYGLYETQKDIVEELFWKAKAYNESRISELSKILNLDKSKVRRMIVGNYIENEDIHKRPLAKFTQDIARQLKLIK